MAESHPPSPDERQESTAPAVPPSETAPATGPRRRHPRLIAALAASVAALVLAAGIGVAGTYSIWHRPAIHTAATTSAPPHTVSQPSSAFSGTPIDAQAVASQASPAVVDINTVLASARGRRHAAGTGMILTSSGLVLTNNHVVKGSTSITVTIQGRSASYVATIVGVDPTDDVALLQIQGVSGLPTVTLADSSTLRVGETVVALGNALGAGGAPSVTQGVITALDQSIIATDGSGGAEHLNGLIESNAQISPGDSGGPLVNSAGQVIGMITAGTATNARQASTTDGYAIPSNTALGIANQIESGQPSSKIYLGATGYLGVAVSDINPVVGSRLGVPVAGGALVQQVVAGSPAATAGISAGAVITRVGDASVSSSTDLGPAIWRHKPGEKVRVDWVDQGGTHSAMVILASGPAA